MALNESSMKSIIITSALLGASFGVIITKCLSERFSSINENILERNCLIHYQSPCMIFEKILPVLALTLIDYVLKICIPIITSSIGTGVGLSYGIFKKLTKPKEEEGFSVLGLNQQ